MLPIQRRLSLIVSFIFSLVVIAYVVRQLDWRATQAALAGLNVAWLLLALLVFIASYILRTLRFQTLLYTGEASFWQLLIVTSLYGMFNYLLPAKSGELTYPVLLKQQMKVSLTESTLTLLAARVFDFATIALFLPVVLLLFWSRLPGWMIYASLIFCGGVFTFVAALLWFLRRPSVMMAPTAAPPARRGLARLWRLWQRLLTGLRLIDQRRQYGRLWLLTIGIWLCVYANFYFIVLSLGYSLNYFQMVVVSVIMVPMTLLPVQGFANLGTHEVGWVAAFALFGYSQQTALNIAVSSHLILLFLVLLLGMGGLLLGFLFDRVPLNPGNPLHP